MLLKQGYRHVYISRAFAKRNGFIPDDATPGYYGYTGLISIGVFRRPLSVYACTRVLNGIFYFIPRRVAYNTRPNNDKPYSLPFRRITLRRRSWTLIHGTEKCEDRYA